MHDRDDVLSRVTAAHKAPASTGRSATAPLPVAQTIQVMAYGATGVFEKVVETPEALRDLLTKYDVTWANVEGAVSAEWLASFGQIFELHPLALEDVANTHQRAKVDTYGNHHYIVARMVSMQRRLETEQVSLFFGNKFVLTFQQELGGDCFDAVRERIRKNGGKIRQEKADHLAYALVDSVVDSYFPVLEELGNRLETLEDHILSKHDTSTPSKIHAIKRDVLMLRRTIWPLRDAVNSLYRDASDLVSAETKVYIRDCYDHAIRIIEMVEMYRELCSDLMQLHLSSVSNRMNEVMKVLAIITSLFIPPTFIASIYGMNFNPDKSPWNMPELNWFFGYPVALAMMTVLVGGLLFFLHWKGWLKDIFRRNRNN